jgi:hypothetical protein
MAVIPSVSRISPSGEGPGFEGVIPSYLMNPQTFRPHSDFWEEIGSPQTVIQAVPTTSSRHPSINFDWESNR